MKFIELSEQLGEETNVSDLPDEVKEFLPDDIKTIIIREYPLGDTNNLIISPTLDWDMGSENILRHIINLKTVTSVGVFNGPSCDIYEKIDTEKVSWICYTLMEEILLFKI